MPNTLFYRSALSSTFQGFLPHCLLFQLIFLLLQNYSLLQNPPIPLSPIFPIVILTVVFLLPFFSKRCLLFFPLPSMLLYCGNCAICFHPSSSNSSFFYFRIILSSRILLFLYLPFFRLSFSRFFFYYPSFQNDVCFFSSSIHAAVLWQLCNMFPSLIFYVVLSSTLLSYL